MWLEIDIRNVCIQHDVILQKTHSLSESHAGIADQSNQPSEIIVLNLTDGLYCPDILDRYWFAFRGLKGLGKERSRKAILAS